MRRVILFILVTTLLLGSFPATYALDRATTEQVPKLLVQTSQLLKDAGAIEEQVKKDWEKLSRKVDECQRRFDRTEPGSQGWHTAKAQLEEAIAERMYAVFSARKAQLDIITRAEANVDRLINLAQRLGDDDRAEPFQKQMAAIKRERQRAARVVKYTGMETEKLPLTPETRRLIDQRYNVALNTYKKLTKEEAELRRKLGKMGSSYRDRVLRFAYHFMIRLDSFDGIRYEVERIKGHALNLLSIIDIDELTQEMEETLRALARWEEGLGVIGDFDIPDELFRLEPAPNESESDEWDVPPPQPDPEQIDRDAYGLEEKV